MDISSNKLAKSLSRRPVYGYERETEAFLKVAQNNAIKTNYIEDKIDNMQQNSKRLLCGDRIEIINQIIRKYSQRAQRV